MATTLSKAELADLGQRLSKVEGRVEEISKRINHLETEISDLRKELTTEIRSLRNWTLGTLIPMWITIILTIIFRP